MRSKCDKQWYQKIYEIPFKADYQKIKKELEKLIEDFQKKSLIEKNVKNNNLVQVQNIKDENYELMVNIPIKNQIYKKFEGLFNDEVLKIINNNGYDAIERDVKIINSKEELRKEILDLIKSNKF